MCSMQVASGKGARGKGDQERGGIPGRHQEPHPWREQPGSSSAVTQNTSRTLVPTSLPSVGLENIVSARSWSRAAYTTDNGPSGRPGSHWPPRGLRGKALRARRTAHAPVGRAGGRPRSPAPSRSPWQRARGGEGPLRGGCYFCRFLFLAATSPWQPSYSARPPPGPAGARDPGYSRPLVPLPSPARCPRPAGRQIDGRRLLKHSGSVSVFMTLTRQRYLLLLFALAARELTFGLSRDGAWHPGVPLFVLLPPAAARGEGLHRPGSSCLKEKKATK